MSNLEIRSGLNEMVKSMGFRTVKTRYGVKYPYIVTLFNGTEIEFRDDANIRKMFQSYADMGETDFIKSKALVDEIKQDEEGQVEKRYTCVKYELKDGRIVRMFPVQLNDNVIIDNYFYLFEKTKKVDIPKK